MKRTTVVALATLLAGSVVATAQDVGGATFEDRNANGIRDAGEPLVADVAVRLYGQSDGSGAVDTTQLTAADGTYSFSPGDGCYLVLPTEPEGWRLGPTRDDVRVQGDPGYALPVGIPRFSVIDQGIANLDAGTLRYSALGDSIATNFNFCELQNFFGSFNYSEDFRDRLACVAPGASITIDEWAVKGEHTDDLLVDDGDANNVFRILSVQPELLSLSMIGNDLLDVDVPSPTQNDINIAVEEVLDARQNLQEALSQMLAQAPQLDITLNSLYDQLAEDCYIGTATTDFHRDWVPIVNRVLRELGWGQSRRVSINEVSAEYAQEDLTGQCSGFGQLICSAASDGIHPIQTGYDLIREKLWEGAGGISLGTRDAANRATQTGADFGMLRRVKRLFPTSFEELGGAAVQSPESAFDDDDAGAVASVQLGLGSEEVRFGDFPDWFDEVKIVKVIAGVRYKTSGTFQDDLYRIEASVSGAFRAPPGHDYIPTDWNYYTPIVGGGGPNAPAVRPDYPGARVLVSPQVSSLRDVSATLTKDPIVNGSGDGYDWPAITHEDLETTEMRVAATSVGATAGTDGRVEVDAVWLDLYGWEAPRPVEASNLTLEKQPNGALRVLFDEVPGADRYNVYVGRSTSLAGGVYDHGDGAPRSPDCGAATSSAGPGRLVADVPAGEVPAGPIYVAVTAHVDDVESPSTFSSDGVEADRSQSVCR